VELSRGCRDPWCGRKLEIFRTSHSSIGSRSRSWDFQQVSNFDRSAYKGPLGIDSAIDTSDVVEELRGSRIDFVARYYRDPTSSLPALSSQEARKLASLGLKIVAVWEQNSPDPENFSYSSGYSDAFSAYKQAKAIGQPAGSAIYFAIDFDAHELEPAKEYFRGIAAGLTPRTRSHGERRQRSGHSEFEYLDGESTIPRFMLATSDGCYLSRARI
jgi:hypothetical protein